MRVLPLFPLLLAATPLFSQQAPMPEPGARVRVTVDGAEPRVHVGVYQTIRDSVLVLQSGSTHVDIPLGRLSRVEVSRGRKGHALAGAGIGFLVGTGATIALLSSGGSTAPCDQGQNQDAASSGECIGAAVAGAAIGAGLGALVGGLIRSERWQDVPVERLRVTVAPQDGRRLSLGIAFAF